MDTVSAALILAVAGGAGGAMGDQAWRNLVALVHHPTRGGMALERGDVQVTRLHKQPNDVVAATELAEALRARADEDSTFRAALAAWRSGVEQLCPAPRTGAVNNTVSGGTFHGPVIQTGTATQYTAGDWRTPTGSGPRPN